MQSFTTDTDFPCSIKFLHGSLKIVSAKIKLRGQLGHLFCFLVGEGLFFPTDEIFLDKVKPLIFVDIRGAFGKFLA